MESINEVNDDSTDTKDTSPMTVMAEPNFKKIKTTTPIVINILLIVN
jgi:hypothetical protein